MIRNRRIDRRLRTAGGNPAGCCIAAGGTNTTGGQSGDAAIAEALTAAKAHHRAGQLRQAEAMYRRVLETAPAQPDAMHMLGMIAYQVGRPEAAVELLARAIAARADDPEMHHDMGNVLQAQGNLDAAIDHYRKALAIQPDHADAHFNLGTVHHAQGNLDEAATSYANAIAIDPGLADAHHNLGTVFQQQGRPADAVESYRRALKFRPDFPDTHFNLGNALKDQGRLDDAVTSYRNALAIKPDHPLVLNNLATVLVQQGQREQAIACFRSALALRPAYADAHSNLGSALRAQGHLDEAIASFRAALTFKSNHATAHIDLGNALVERGRPDEAANAFRHALSLRPNADLYFTLGIVEMRRGDLAAAGTSFFNAITVKPDFAEAHNNLGNVLYQLGRVDEAIKSYRRALELSDAAEIKTSFVRCIMHVDFVDVDPDVRQLVTRALSEPWARPSDLASAAVKLVSLDRDIGACIERVARAWPRRLRSSELFGLQGLPALASDALLHALLENAQACALALERLVTTIRHALLATAVAAIPGDEIDVHVLTFYCAVARQCFLNEYVYSFTTDEYERAQQLRDKLDAAAQAGTRIPLTWFAAVGAYFPLSTLVSAATLAGQTWPEPVAALLVQQVTEPIQEQRNRVNMRHLTAVDDAVSRKVQQQYEENPFPRWIKLPPAGKPLSLDAYLRAQFPYVSYASIGTQGGLDILVAGCGTGQESIEMAQQFPDARVLAVDLSLASLGYAKRKSDERGLANIEYAQGDINRLGSIGMTFDIISSVGVLHHLNDPLAGWQQLLSLLRPGGFMLLGFYSERARQHIVAARTFIARHGYGSTTSEIRRFREDVTSGENAQTFAQLLAFRDFYVTSEIRDLLFHVQEHRFTLTQIKQHLADLRLDFVGFLLEPHVNKKYSERFPNDKARVNLDHWNAFEGQFPETFISTYAFWVQKPMARRP